MSAYFLTTKNKEFQKTLDYCKKVANSNVNILLSGESGTGKEVLAKYIHSCSQRRDQNFVAVNCSTYSETLLESELFGHEQGAYTGATSSRKGKFEIADNGTFFLDEVGDINGATQLKLLRVIETKTTERLGGNDPINIDFRLISATHQNLKDAVSLGVFREDFFYRISTVVIKVPSLVERKEDLGDLIEFFIGKSCDENSIKINDMDPKVVEFLYSYDYPGNIRELKNIIDRMVILSENGKITVDGLPIMYAYHKQSDAKEKTPQYTCSCYSAIVPFQQFKQQSEKEYLEWVLQQTGGNVAEASRQLQMSTRQLFNKINDLNIKK